MKSFKSMSTIALFALCFSLNASLPSFADDTDADKIKEEEINERYNRSGDQLSDGAGSIWKGVKQIGGGVVDGARATAEVVIEGGKKCDRDPKCQQWREEAFKSRN